MSKSIQWAPNGALSGVPGEVTRFLATNDGRTFGYGHGAGWSIIFRHEHGEVSLLPSQWLTKNDDGSFSVTDENPESRAAVAEATAVDPEWACGCNRSQGHLCGECRMGLGTHRPCDPRCIAHTS